MRGRWTMKKASKRICIIITSILLIVVAIPFIVNILFSVNAPFQMFVAKWEASDALNYCATIISFLGTIFLGIVTLIQNQRLHDEANRLSERNSMLEKYYASQPFFTIRAVNTVSAIPSKGQYWIIDSDNIGNHSDSDILATLVLENATKDYKGVSMRYRTGKEAPKLSEPFFSKFCKDFDFVSQIVTIPLTKQQIQIDGIHFCAIRFNNIQGLEYQQQIPIVAYRNAESKRIDKLVVYNAEPSVPIISTNS